MDHPVAILHTTYIHWSLQRVCGTRIRGRRCCICVQQIFWRKHKGILVHIETNERGDMPRSCAFWGYAGTPKNVIPHFYTSATQQHSFIIGGVEDVSVEMNRGITRANCLMWLGLRDWPIIFNTKKRPLEPMLLQVRASFIHSGPILKLAEY